MLLRALENRYHIWRYAPPNDSDAEASIPMAENGQSVSVANTSRSMASTSDDSNSTTTDANHPKDEEDDIFYTPPPGALAAPNLLHRALAVLLSSESHIEPALLPALINADTNSAVSQWDDTKTVLRDVKGRLYAQKALRRADEAAEMMLACSDRVSRKVRDAARRRILIKRNKDIERMHTDTGFGCSSKRSAAVNIATSKDTAEMLRDEYENIKRCKLLFTPLCLFCMDCGVLELYISASKASHYAVDIVSTGLPMVAKLLYGISQSHNKMKLMR